jgi:hypothetical protein
MKFILLNPGLFITIALAFLKSQHLVFQTKKTKAGLFINQKNLLWL